MPRSRRLQVYRYYSNTHETHLSPIETVDNVFSDPLLPSHHEVYARLPPNYVNQPNVFVFGLNVKCSSSRAIVIALFLLVKNTSTAYKTKEKKLSLLISNIWLPIVVSGVNSCTEGTNTSSRVISFVRFLTSFRFFIPRHS